MKIGGIRQGNHPAGLQHLDAALTAMNCSTSYVCISKKQLVCVQALADAGCVVYHAQGLQWQGGATI